MTIICYTFVWGFVIIIMRERGYVLMLKNKNTCLLLITAILISIKYIVTDFGIDSAFQVSMSYRLATGDVMFADMLEPYQTSAFLCAGLIKLYLLLFGTTTGIVIYLQVCGAIINAVISLIVYKTIIKYFEDPQLAAVSAFIFFLVSPKDVPIAEYSNMQIWFSMLLVIYLFRYIQENKIRDLIAAAIFLCLTVLSYPSCLILYFGVLFILLRYAKKSSSVVFSAVCGLCGAGYLVIVLCITDGGLARCLEDMIALESSHTDMVSGKAWWYLKELLAMAGCFAAIYGFSYASVKLIDRLAKRNNNSIRERVLLVFFAITAIWSMLTVFFINDNLRYSYSVIFIAIIITGFSCRRYLSNEQYSLYITGLTVSVMNFIATMLLTNLSLISVVPYLLIALVVSFGPVACLYKRAASEGKRGLRIYMKMAVAGFLILIVIRNIYVIRPLNGHVSTIFSIRGIVHDGPAKGIITEYMGAYIQNETLKEWAEYIKEGDSVFLVGGELDTLGYLYEDVIISAPTTVPTPTYNDTILRYWDLHPEKYPDVIVVSCWYGNLNNAMDEGTWIRSWIENEYKYSSYIDGKYWRYYFK